MHGGLVERLYGGLIIRRTWFNSTARNQNSRGTASWLVHHIEVKLKLESNFLALTPILILWRVSQRGHFAGLICRPLPYGSIVKLA